MQADVYKVKGSSTYVFVEKGKPLPPHIGPADFVKTVDLAVPGLIAVNQKKAIDDITTKGYHEASAGVLLNEKLGP